MMQFSQHILMSRTSAAPRRADPGPSARLAAKRHKIMSLREVLRWVPALRSLRSLGRDKSIDMKSFGNGLG
jgi:hypothetical protein